MATVQQIINSAYRRSGIAAYGVPISATRSTVGLERVVDMYHDLLAQGTMGKFHDVYLVSGSTYTALENDRITCADDTVTVTIPDVYYDPAYNDPWDYGFNGSGNYQYNSSGVPRAPHDFAKIQVIQPFNMSVPLITQIYDITAGAWINIEGLTLTSFAPFSGRYEEGLKNYLAVWLADEGGYAPRPLAVRNAARFKMSLATRFDGPRQTVRQAGNFF